MDKLIGKFIGAGWHRAVFAHKKDPTLVIKVAHRHLSGRRNRMEWAIWNNAPEYVKKWLVPCIKISDDGFYLVCKRGSPAKNIPHPFPFTGMAEDMKSVKNWVEIGGNLLLTDYATLRMYKKYRK